MKIFHEIRNYDTDIMAWYHSYDNIGFLAHWHQEIEFIYVKSGSSKISIMDKTFFATTGDLLICDSGDIHFCESNNIQNQLIFLVFDPSLINPLFKELHINQPHISSEQLEILGLKQPLQRLISTLSTELQNTSSYYKEIIKSVLCEFWYLLKRTFPTTSANQIKSYNNFHNLPQFQKLLSEIEEHFDYNWSLNYAANKMNFTPCHFSKIFTKFAGINFTAYLNIIRIENAALLIRTTSSKMLEIAFNCGYNNSRTFNRVFKEIVGYTPSYFQRLSNEKVEELSCFKKRTHIYHFTENVPFTLKNNL